MKGATVCLEYCIQNKGENREKLQILVKNAMKILKQLLIFFVIQIDQETSDKIKKISLAKQLLFSIGFPLSPSYTS